MSRNTVVAEGVFSLSIELMEAVWDNPHFTGVQTAVLVRLAKHANKQGGSIHPGIESLSDSTGFNRRSILRVIATATKEGILTQTGHHGRHPLYSMHQAKIESFTATPNSDTESPLDVTESHPTEIAQVTESHFYSDTQSRSSDTQSPDIERARKTHERSIKGHKEKSAVPAENPEHQIFHEIEGNKICDEAKCMRLQKWVEEEKAEAVIIDTVKSMRDSLRYEPKGSPQRPYAYDTASGKVTRYSDLWMVARRWSKAELKRQVSGRQNGYRRPDATSNEEWEGF